MSKAEKKVKMWWHSEGNFNTTKDNERIKYNKSLDKMRRRLFSIDNATWEWHIILTFSPESVKYWFKTAKSPTEALTYTFKKIRYDFPGLKFFWKYEEGDKNNQPHYHTLWDFQNRTKRKEGWWCERCGWTKKYQGRNPSLVRGNKNHCNVCKASIEKKEISKQDWFVELKEIDLKKLIFPHNWTEIDWSNYLENQRKWWWNQTKLDGKITIKSDFEILMHDYMVRKWGYEVSKEKSKKIKKQRKEGVKVSDVDLWGGKYMINGHPLCRKLRDYHDLVAYVRKDFFGYSEAEYLAKRKNKFNYSRNLTVNSTLEGQLKPTKEWNMVLEELGWFEVPKALEMLENTKSNLIDYYNDMNWNGEFIYSRIVMDIMKGASFQTTFKKKKV